jgi:hypothetical protein
MRANKGLGRTAARNLRLAREAEEAKNTTPSPYHVRKANRPTSQTRASKIVVTLADVNSLAKIQGRTRLTAHRRRKLAQRLRNQQA